MQCVYIKHKIISVLAVELGWQGNCEYMILGETLWHIYILCCMCYNNYVHDIIKTDHNPALQENMP